MAVIMTDEELEKALATGTMSQDCGYGPTDEAPDDYVNAELWYTQDGKPFRYTIQSGFDSPHMGGMNIGEWLTDEEASNPEVFT